MRGWPAATIAFYGPDVDRASKVAVGIVPYEAAEVTEIRAWQLETGDVRADAQIAQEILESTRRPIAGSIGAVAFANC